MALLLPFLLWIIAAGLIGPATAWFFWGWQPRDDNDPPSSFNTPSPVSPV